LEVRADSISSEGNVVPPPKKKEAKKPLSGSSGENRKIEPVH